MSKALYPTAEKAALYIQKGYGAKPEFRGYHAITGDLTKNDGDHTPVWAYLAGQAVKIAEQRGTPDDVTVSIDGPLQAIADLAGKQQDCPIDLLVVIDNCLTAAQKMQWGRWGSTAPEIIIAMPDAKITQRGLSNLLSREGQQPMVLGNFQARFPDWIIINGKSALRTQKITDYSVKGIATTTCSGCGDSMCGGIAGCSEWYASIDNGTAKKSMDGGSTWDALEVAVPFTYGNAIYADPLVVLIGGNNGINGWFGVQRSTDSGATFTQIVFDTSEAGQIVLVRDILRYQNSLFVMADDGIWRSGDDGETWVRVLVEPHVWQGAFGEDGFGVAAAIGGLFVTTDGGLHWTAVSDSDSPRDVAIAGGYVHVVFYDGGSYEGYCRIPISDLRQGDMSRIVQMDQERAFRIDFCNKMVGYRLNGSALERTINGGYSWEVVDGPGGFQPNEFTFCGSRVAVCGGNLVGFYDPGFETPIVAGGGADCGC